MGVTITAIIVFLLGILFVAACIFSWAKSPNDDEDSK